MSRFIVRRLIGAALTVLAALTLIFFALNAVPGDPAQAALSDSAVSRDVIQRRREALGLDLPLGLQYLRFMSRLFQGNLGISWASGQPVAVIIGEQLASTLSLAAGGTLIAVVAGIALGAISAASRMARIAQFVSSLLVATPTILSGTLMIWIFSVWLGWLPATGQGDLPHLALPATVLGLSAGSGIAKAVEAGMLDALSKPFTRFARAKGLSRRQTVWRHALRVGMIPAVEVMALQLGFMLGGTVVTETLFARQGVGRVLAAAVLAKDLPVVEGIAALSVAVYSALHVLTDVTIAWLDPRIRYES